jgi:hypothetical protein
MICFEMCFYPQSVDSKQNNNMNKIYVYSWFVKMYTSVI